MIIIGDEAYYRLPKKIEALSGRRVVQIHTFGAHSVALTGESHVVFSIPRLTFL